MKSFCKSSLAVIASFLVMIVMVAAPANAVASVQNPHSPCYIDGQVTWQHAAGYCPSRPSTLTSNFNQYRLYGWSCYDVVTFPGSDPNCHYVYGAWRSFGGTYDSVVNVTSDQNIHELYWGFRAN